MNIYFFVKLKGIASVGNYKHGSESGLNALLPAAFRGGNGLHTINSPSSFQPLNFIQVINVFFTLTIQVETLGIYICPSAGLLVGVYKLDGLGTVDKTPSTD